MRKVAANKVYMTKNIVMTNHIVEIYDNFVVNHYPIDSEVDMTEWIGGSIVICYNSRLRQIAETYFLENKDERFSFDSLFNLLEQHGKDSIRPLAYHVTVTEDAENNETFKIRPIAENKMI